MELISPIHGKIIYEDKDIVSFKKAIPGFENINKYILTDLYKDSPFKLLQAIDDVNIGFILISPFDVIDNYEIEISDSLQKRLNIQKSTDVCLYSLITLSSNVNNITANLKAPLVINIKSMEGEQFITECDEYKIKHPIKKG